MSQRLIQLENHSARELEMHIGSRLGRVPKLFLDTRSHVVTDLQKDDGVDVRVLEMTG